MTYAMTELKAKAIEDLYDHAVASVVSNNALLQAVTEENEFLCYVSVKKVDFPATVTTLSFFGLTALCTLPTCLALSNQLFSKFSVPENEQRIQLFMSSSVRFQSALLFFQENGFKYEMSFEGDIAENLWVRRVVPASSFTLKLLQMIRRG